jgi:hypothetical protein
MAKCRSEDSTEYGDERYERLAAISVPHIYNLRKSQAYRKRRIAYQKTRPVEIAMGERRKPTPKTRGSLSLRLSNMETIERGWPRTATPGGFGRRKAVPLF